MKNQTVFEPIVPSTDSSVLTDTSTTVYLSTTLPEINQPFVCFNKSAVAPDPKKLYGYFHREVIVKSNCNVIDWLRV